MKEEIFYCAKCRAYVSEEDASCPVCGTLFSDLISIDKADLTEVVSFSNEFEAEIVKAKLSEAGIESVIFHESAGGLYPSLNNAFGIKIFVNLKDADRAKILVEENTGLQDDIEEDFDKEKDNQ
jgi:hypothetical protein